MEKASVEPAVIDPRYEMAYQESLRSIQQQQQVLSELRARTATLIAVATIATSFLGAGSLIGEHTPGGWAWVAVAAFALTCGLAISVLWPRRSWGFGCYASILIESWIEEAKVSLNQMYRERALRLQGNYEDNRTKLTRLFYLFAAMNGVLIIEIAAWLLHLWRG